MAKNGNTPTVRELAPFQRKFIDEFLTPSSEMRFCRLAWPVGTGKTFTAAHLLRHLFLKNPAARVLVVADLVFIQQQFREMLFSLGVSAKSVDRYEYRMMEDAVIDGDIMWPPGRAYLLNRHFAGQDDIVDSLSSVDWTLLVLLASDDLFVSDQLANKIFSTSSGARLLVLSDAAMNHGTMRVKGQALKTVRLDRADLDKLMSYSSNRNGAPTVEVIATEQTVIENDLRRSVASLIDAISIPALHSKAAADDLSLRFESSPIAFEEAAWELRNRLAHGTPSWLFSDIEIKDSDMGQMIANRPTEANQVYGALTNYLDTAETLSTDSKLNAFRSTLQKELGTNSDIYHSCVFSSYSSTLLYLQASLEEVGVPTYLLVDSESPSERRQVIEKFIAHGGLLLGSIALLSDGVDFSFVDSLILYDLPGTPAMFNHLYERFGLGGRARPLKIIAFDRQGSVKPGVAERIGEATRTFHRS